MYWQEAPENGGSPVESYRIFYAIGSGSFTTLTFNLVETSFIAENLAVGTTYSFKV
jgi:hypothetical protein